MNIKIDYHGHEVSVTCDVTYCDGLIDEVVIKQCKLLVGEKSRVIDLIITEEIADLINEQIEIQVEKILAKSKEERGIDTYLLGKP
jgi:hypothetical protein